MCRDDGRRTTIPGSPMGSTRFAQLTLGLESALALRSGVNSSITGGYLGVRFCDWVEFRPDLITVFLIGACRGCYDRAMKAIDRAS